MELTLADIASAAGGVLRGAPSPDLLVRGVTWDSREVSPGCLYVALPGQRHDGHEFIAEAARAGAAGALVTRAEDRGLPLIVVDDTPRALANVARAWRDRLEGTVIGLTGSTGKTTTKNLVRDVLAAAGGVVATRANQNNELGVPNTLLAADEGTGAVVVEMGMRGLGQIAELCAIARPDWGLVTNVGESHIELLGSRENIARAKSELLCSLPDGSGIAFLNAADELTGDIVRLARLDERGVKKVFFDGSGTGGASALRLGRAGDGASFVWADDIALDAQGRASFTLNAVDFEGADDGSCRCDLELRGIHNVSNACSAAAVGLMAGLSLAQCCAVLAASQPERGRQQLRRAACGALVVDDAYNANPDSMRAALATFAALDVAGARIAVLGDMGELGPFAPECHERVGRMAARSGLDRLICVGPLSAHIADAAVAGGMDDALVEHYDGLAEALGRLRGLIGDADAVLVKASHFMQFDKIVEGLVS